MIETKDGNQILWVDRATYEGLWRAVFNEEIPKDGFTSLEIGNVKIFWR